MNARVPPRAPTSTELADERTKLAVVRTIVALNRTLMAWIRTAVSMLSFGFTIYKFFQALREGEPARQTRLMTPRGVALVLMGVGIGGLLVATMEYRRQIQELHATYSHYGPFRQSPAFAVATIVAGLGVVGFVLVFLRQ